MGDTNLNVGDAAMRGRFSLMRLLGAVTLLAISLLILPWSLEELLCGLWACAIGVLVGGLRGGVVGAALGLLIGPTLFSAIGTLLHLPPN